MEFKVDPLPKGFVLSKPIQWGSYDESVIYDLEHHSRLVMTRKRDGYSLRAVWHNGKIKFYTAGNNEVDGRLDHIKPELARRLKGLKTTILAGEGIFDIDGQDDFSKVTSFFKAGYDEAMRIQRELGMARLMVFNLAAYDGHVNVEQYGKTYQQMNALLMGKPEYVFPVPVLPASYGYDTAKRMVMRDGWEGLVLYDVDFKLQYRLDGKDPKRPKGCYKWKPILEDDFIVRTDDRRWSPEDAAKLKDVVLRQIDSTTGKEFSCGRLGAFGKETRALLSDAKNFPLVMKVIFEDRFAKTGKLRNARLDSIRDDKPPEHCIASQSYPEAEFCK